MELQKVELQGITWYTKSVRLSNYTCKILLCYTGWKFTNISKDTGNYELKVEHVEVQQSKHNTLGPLQLLWDRLIQFKHRITLSGASFTPREIVQYGNIVIYYIVIYHMLTLTVWCGFRTINPWIANSFTIGNLRPFSTSHYNHSTYEGSPFFFFFPSRDSYQESLKPTFKENWLLFPSCVPCLPSLSMLNMLGRVGLN